MCCQQGVPACRGVGKPTTAWHHHHHHSGLCSEFRAELPLRVAGGLQDGPSHPPAAQGLLQHPRTPRSKDLHPSGRRGCADAFFHPREGCSAHASCLKLERTNENQERRAFFGLLCASLTQQRMSDGLERSHPDSCKPGPDSNSSSKLQVKHWLNTFTHLGAFSPNCV